MGAARSVTKRSHEIGKVSPNSNQGGFVSLWLLVLIIVIVVLLVGGFGYSRR